MSNSESIVFAEENNISNQPVMLQQDKPPWKIMIIDDDQDVHKLTRMVLRDFVFENRTLTFLFGLTGEDAKQLMSQHPDTAILLLDVVMEREQSGLEAVQYIREILQNQFVRIILRTGQPGRAPEQTVISAYDINDYKEKTELTAQKLVTVVTASLRSYRDLKIIEENRHGLEKILHATGNLFEPTSLKKLATSVLVQLVFLLELEDSALCVQSSGFAATQKNDQLILYAGTGVYSDKTGKTAQEAMPAETWALVENVLREEQSLCHENCYIGFFRTKNGTKNLLFLQGNHPLDLVDQKLIEIFSVNVALAFDSVYANRDMIDSQRKLTFSLGAIVDAHSNQAENHLRRVADSARLLAQKVGLSDEEAEILWLSAPLHDLGKIAIPDFILTKPGKLTPEEWDVMKAHTDIGARLLKNANHDILQVGANIARMHHERWDGLGYPGGLVAEQIPIFSRITALIDVFDTLSHDRYYEKAWESSHVLAFIQQQSGHCFDPRLVELFLENFEEFQEIQNALPDSNNPPYDS